MGIVTNSVCAPTDQAFMDLIAALEDAIGEEATGELLSDLGFLTDVLLYHVTDGRRFSNSVINKNNMKAIETLFEGHYIWSKPSLMIVDESYLTDDAGIVDKLINTILSRRQSTESDNAGLPGLRLVNRFNGGQEALVIIQEFGGLSVDPSAMETSFAQCIAQLRR
jgi:hypothetical protein